jgi:CubicO group peptidase (beta-lactamase class C family)
MLALPTLFALLMLASRPMTVQAFVRAPPEAAICERETLQVGEAGERIVAYVHRAQDYGFSGAVLAAKGGQVVAAVGVGTADLEGVSPNTPSTLFEIASATKQFTAAAVMRLVQDGRLGLDDPISLHLPDVPDNCSAITIRHLLQHTSGIPGTNSRGAGDDLSKVLPDFLRGGPRHPPGMHWAYWNQGYALTTEIIARASGKEYTRYCQQTLFAPAGMLATRFTGDAPPAIEGVNVAIGQTATGRPRSALGHPYGNTYGLQYRGMGGVVTNVWDLWRWDRALHNLDAGCVLNADAQATLFKPGLNDYALGWFVRKDMRCRAVQSHGGGVRGFACELRRLPDDDGCVFVLSNRDDGPTGAVAQAVQAILLGPPYTSVDLPSAPAADLIKDVMGKYKDSKGNELSIKAAGKAVRATICWAMDRSLTTRAFLGIDKDGGPVLFEWSTTTKVTLSRDDHGAVAAISIDDQRFDRTE